MFFLPCLIVLVTCMSRVFLLNVLFDSKMSRKNLPHKILSVLFWRKKKTKNIHLKKYLLSSCSSRSYPSSSLSSIIANTLFTISFDARLDFNSSTSQAISPLMGLQSPVARKIEKFCSAFGLTVNANIIVYANHWSVAGFVLNFSAN